MHRTFVALEHKLTGLSNWGRVCSLWGRKWRFSSDRRGQSVWALWCTHLTVEQVFLGVLWFILVSSILPTLHSLLYLITVLTYEHSQTQPWKSPSNGVYGVWKQRTQHTTHLYFYGWTAPAGTGPPHCWGFTVTLRHTTLGATPLDEWSVRRRDLYLTAHNSYNRQTDMPPDIFEPAIPASERPQTHDLTL